MTCEWAGCENTGEWVHLLGCTDEHIQKLASCHTHRAELWRKQAHDRWPCIQCRHDIEIIMERPMSERIEKNWKPEIEWD